MENSSPETNPPVDLAQLQANLASLAAAVQTLYDERANANSGPAPASVPASATVPASNFPAFPVKTPKLKTPPEYDGKNKSACSTFISHLNLYINACPTSFPSDNAKVLFAASYLRDRAFAWLEPHLLHPDTPMLHDFQLFTTELLRNLGDPDRERNTTRKLYALIQTASAAAYSAEFFQLAAFLNWNDDALRAQFYNGLKPEVKDALALANTDPEDVKTLSDLAIRLDNRIHERRMDQKRSTRPSHQNYSRISAPTQPAATSVLSRSTPMELDATKSKRFQPLTQEERNRRMENNLCLYCGNPGHRAGECPNKSKSQRPGAIRATLSPADDEAYNTSQSGNA